MPESKIRKKAAYTPPPEKKTPIKLDTGNGITAPLMIGFFVLGLLWIVVYYLSSATYPIPPLHGWNMAIGFGLIIAGFVTAMRWK